MRTHQRTSQSVADETCPAHRLYGGILTPVRTRRRLLDRGHRLLPCGHDEPVQLLWVTFCRMLITQIISDMFQGVRDTIVTMLEHGRCLSPSMLALPFRRHGDYAFAFASEVRREQRLRGTMHGRRLVQGLRVSAVF